MEFQKLNEIGKLAAEGSYSLYILLWGQNQL